MIIFLSELQKEHLNFLHQHSIQVLVDFCKLGIDYLNNGCNLKKYHIAAAVVIFFCALTFYKYLSKVYVEIDNLTLTLLEKLNVSTSAIQNVVHALVYLIVEGCKHGLSESDFKASLAIAGFSDEQQEVLTKLYGSKKTELSGSLQLLNQKDPSYQDFTWRFEIQIASRASSEEIKPMVAMRLMLMTPKNFAQTIEDKEKDELLSKSSRVSPMQIDSSIQDAKAASHCQYVISHVLLQCDLPNLVHLTNKLEQALKESKSQHVRKVQRAL